MHPNVHSSIVHNCQDMEAASVSINREMDKKDAVYVHIYHISYTLKISYAHTHMCVCIYIYIYIYIYHTQEILLSHKKNELLPFATAWLDLEGIMQSEISQRKTNTI